ncbi:MAG: M13 family peptidase, partial [Chitinophagaceae bacterium]
MKPLLPAALLAFTLAGTGLAGPAAVAQQKFIDPANMDLSYKPGDDFYMYSGGTWIRNNPVPAKETRWGAFNQLRDFNINAVKDIL